MTPGVRCWHHRKSKARAAAPGSCNLGRPRQHLSSARAPATGSLSSQACQSPAPAPDAAASTASRPAYRDDRERPSMWDGMYRNIFLHSRNVNYRRRDARACFFSQRIRFQSSYDGKSRYSCCVKSARDQRSSMCTDGWLVSAA